MNRFLLDLWQSLGSVRSLRFTAQSKAATGWQGEGVGSVVVENPSDTVTIFSESGRWHPAVGPETNFSNVYRWTIVGDDLLRLEHLRFGSSHPVYLFDLVPTANGAWLSGNPHICRDDCYAAVLRLHDGGIWLQWSISGPEKDESIAYEYSHG